MKWANIFNYNSRVNVKPILEMKGKIYIYMFHVFKTKEGQLKTAIYKISPHSITARQL